MVKYLVKRLFYIIPIVLMVNFLTFVLFFVINSTDNVARSQLGGKYTTKNAIMQWKKSHGYDLPLFYNEQQSGFGAITQTLFVKKSIALLMFNFGQSLAGRDIKKDLKERMMPSLAIALPSLLFGLVFNIFFALLSLSFANTKFGNYLMTILVAMMSVSGMFYIIGCQYWLAKVAQLAPISGWQFGLDNARFIWMPVLVSVLSGLGAGSRWYLAIFSEEQNKDYVLTAKAKGGSEYRVLFKHIFPNGLVPIVTGVVAILPLLFMGSLILESFFGIPGLGSYVLDAISAQDFEIIRSIVFLGTLLYLLGLFLTDIVYVAIDPRIRFE